MNVLVTSGAMYFTNELHYSEGYNAYCLCRALAENGVRLTILSPSASDSTTIDGANIIGFGKYEFPGNLRYFALKWLGYNVNLLLKAKQVIREVQPDLIHHIFPSWIDYGYSFYPIFDRERPFVYGPVLTQADIDISGQVSRKDRVVDFYRNTLSRRLYVETLRRADRIILSVNDALKFLPSFVDEKSTTICHGIDTEFFSPATSKTEEPNFKVTYLGRLVPDKGATIAIEAISEARKDIPNVLLQIIGKGPQRAELEALASRIGVEDSVHFLGHVPDKDVPSLLRESDVFCCPSIADASPSVLLQAMACEVPIVASNVGGISEMLGQGNHGLLVPPGDTSELSRALVLLHNDIRLRQKIGKKGRLEAKKNYDWSVIARKVISVYEECLA